MSSVILNIILAIVAFLLAIISIGGETWRKNGVFLSKLTLRGWLSIFLLFIIVSVTIVKEIVTNNETEELKKLVEKINGSQEILLTEHEYKSAEVGTNYSYAKQLLGEPQFSSRINFCGKVAFYHRWSDRSQNSIQLIVDTSGIIITNSQFNPYLPLNYANIRLSDHDVADYSKREFPPELYVFGSSIFGMVESFGASSVTKNKKIYVGRLVGERNRKTIDKIGHARMEYTISDKLSWQEKFKITYGELRQLADDSSFSKLGVALDLDHIHFQTCPNDLKNTKDQIDKYGLTMFHSASYITFEKEFFEP